MTIVPAFKTSALLFALALPLAAQAHKAWLQPSKTVLNVGQWITVDAGTSTEPFVKDHNPFRLDQLAITAPDGSTVAAENLVGGKLRNSFDLQLKQAGTYRLAVVSDGMTASWQEQGQRKSWPPRGQPFTAEGFAREVPLKAEQLKVTQSQRRIETFASAGKPSEGALKPSNRGLELVPVSGVNDLYTGETARFRLLLDGQPAAGVAVELVPDGQRYRNAVGDLQRVTDAEGVFSVDWTQPGLWWLSASVEDGRATAPATERRASYSATLEVLSP